MKCELADVVCFHNIIPSRGNLVVLRPGMDTNGGVAGLTDRVRKMIALARRKVMMTKGAMHS